ncbi:MAG: Uma2 family endonuclease [Cyanobacteria bacterium P01_F01_bin.150]
MVSVTARSMSFEDYLTYEDKTDNRYEWIDGVLVQMPPESEPNAWLALALQLYFINTGLVKPRLTHRYNCEIEVPTFKTQQPRNRFPDFVILQPEHIALTQKRLTIRMEMPPPLFVMEVVSPGSSNRARDYKDKRQQYEALGIPEYWLLDPEQQQVTVLSLEDNGYRERCFKGNQIIRSPLFPAFSLTAQQVLNPPE